VRDTLAPYPWSGSISWCLAAGYGNGDQRRPMSQWLGKDFIFLASMNKLKKTSRAHSKSQVTITKSQSHSVNAGSCSLESSGQSQATDKFQNSNSDPSLRLASLSLQRTAALIAK